MAKNMNFPTSRHENFLNYAIRFCRLNNFGMILEGSCANGAAFEFSDIDIILCGEISPEKIRNFICGYNELAGLWFTKIPNGILVLLYKNLLSVDLDVRKTVTTTEIDSGIIISDVNIKIANEAKRYNLESRFPKISRHVENFRLIHRAAIKILCGRNVQSLLDDVILATRKITGISIPVNLPAKEILHRAHTAFCEKCCIKPNMADAVSRLIKHIS